MPAAGGRTRPSRRRPLDPNATVLSTRSGSGRSERLVVSRNRLGVPATVAIRASEVGSSSAMSSMNTTSRLEPAAATRSSSRLRIAANSVTGSAASSSAGNRWAIAASGMAAEVSVASIRRKGIACEAAWSRHTPANAVLPVPASPLIEKPSQEGSANAAAKRASSSCRPAKGHAGNDAGASPSIMQSSYHARGPQLSSRCSGRPRLGPRGLLCAPEPGRTPTDESECTRVQAAEGASRDDCRPARHGDRGVRPARRRHCLPDHRAAPGRGTRSRPWTTHGWRRSTTST